MYGAAKHVIVTAIFNFSKAKVVMKKIIEAQKQKGLK